LIVLQVNTTRLGWLAAIDAGRPLKGLIREIEGNRKIARKYGYE
jgi:hypothetical protein